MSVGTRKEGKGREGRPVREESGAISEVKCRVKNGNKKKIPFHPAKEGEE